MSKKYFILLISLVILTMIGFFSGDVYSLGHYKGMGNSVIGGSVRDCNFCHDFVNGYYENPDSTHNLRWVKTRIKFCSTNKNRACIDDSDCPSGETCSFERLVKFDRFSKDDPPPQSPPYDGTLADGDDSKLDGPCEVCHTQTKYHTNTGDGTNHENGTNCTVCHPHFLDDITHYFEPTFPGGQSHYTHIAKFCPDYGYVNDPKGPRFPSDACTECHSSYDKKIFNDDLPFETTHVCDTCHSPDGEYKGVDDTVIGAKANWYDGTYESVEDVCTPIKPTWPSALREGKENWCLGCHDDVPATIQNVSAPNVAGDNVTFGYNVTGHGIKGDPPVTCLGPLPFGCHDSLETHIDGNPLGTQTYVASLKNYRSGYRLAGDMAIPRNGQWGSGAFDLCFKCHIYSKVFGDVSNFRYEYDDPNTPTKQLHDEHVGKSARSTIVWDSDWDGSCTFTDPSCADSAMSCTACHNPHGSPCTIGGVIVSCAEPDNAPMIRHGELISTPTRDWTPALDFRWYESDGITETTALGQSLYGDLLCGQSADVTLNHVCWGCHARGRQVYKRVPQGEFITINRVWITNWSNLEPPGYVPTPGGEIRYQVSFTINGLSTYSVKANGRARNITGAYWRTLLRKSDTLAAGTYIWYWDEHIPAGATSPSRAKVIMPITMYDSSGTTQISTDQKIKKFDIP